MIRIEILGDVIPAARPRFSGRKCYQSARNREYREQVAWAAKMAMCGAEPLDGEICAVVKVYRKYRRTARVFGDVDNHLKALFDGLSGIVDSALYRGKVYGQGTPASRNRNQPTISSRIGASAATITNVYWVQVLRKKGVFFCEPDLKKAPTRGRKK